MAETQVRKILVQVDTKGAEDLRTIAASMGNLNRTVSGLSSGMGFLKNAFLGYFAALRVTELAQASDAMQNLYNRIKVLSGGTAQADEVFQGLLERSNATRSGITDLAEVYARLGANLKDTGISSKLLLDVTELLQNTFRLSGASAAEASSAAIQLSQGLAFGVLRGQDLRAVLSANVEIGNLLAKQLGITRGEVYKFAESGKITAYQVLSALFKGMGDVNARAGQLSITFEQALTVAANKVKVAIFELNQEFNLSGKFANGIDTLLEKLSLIGVVAISLAATQIPALITALQRLGNAFLAFGAENPVTAAIVGISIIIMATFKNLTDFENFLIRIYARMVDIEAGYYGLKAGANAFLAGLAGISKYADSDADKSAGLKAYAKSLRDSIAVVEKPVDTGPVRSTNEEIKKFLDHLASIQKVPEGKIKDILGAINKQYLDGKLSLQGYNDALDDFDIYKLNRQFKEGKTELEAYKNGLDQLNRLVLQRDFNQGAISIEAYNRNMRTLDIQSLNDKFARGKITLEQYQEEMLKLSKTFDTVNVFSVGVNNYLNSVGTLATGIAGVITDAFKHLEDTFVEFVKTGKFNFAQFTQSVLDDLERIIIRSTIIAPLAKGLLSFISPTPAAGVTADNFDFSTTAATGAAFSNGVRAFASGGLVSSPTMFSYNGGNSLGLMGEAGTEAIMPLKRHSNGDLGVQATTAPVSVNIYNQGNNDVSTQEKTNADGSKYIEVFIKQKMSENFANGAMDKVLRASYGLQRKGS